MNIIQWLTAQITVRFVSFFTDTEFIQLFPWPPEQPLPRVPAVAEAGGLAGAMVLPMLKRFALSTETILLFITVAPVFGSPYAQ
jgi:hypothetical protein